MLKYLLASLLLIGAGFNSAYAASSKPQADEAAVLFDGQKIHTLHLSIAPKEWAAMRPAAEPQSPQAPEPAVENFPYVHGDVELEGKTCKDVGIRFKGSSSYRMAGAYLKYSFKLDFNRFAKGQEFFGLTALNLNSNVMDPTCMRESLAYAIFRQAGVPASRTAFAKVYLTVPGEHDRRYLGLYTLVEDVNKSFLKNHFNTNKGLLLKPEAARDLPYMGDNWPMYKQRYEAETEGSDALRQRFIDFTRMLHKADDETFRLQIESYMDVDEFLRFLAVHVLLSNFDSLLGTGQNFYLYLSPATLKISWIPWDLNEAFAGFVVAGPVEAQMDLSIDHPHMGDNRLIDRVLGIAEYRQAYHKHLQGLMEAALDMARLEATRKLLAETVAQEKVEVAQANQKPELKVFMTRRAESVKAQLAGQSRGRVLQREPGLVQP